MIMVLAIVLMMPTALSALPLEFGSCPAVVVSTIPLELAHSFVFRSVNSAALSACIRYTTWDTTLAL